MIAHACNRNIQKTEAEEPQVQAQTGLHIVQGQPLLMNQKKKTQYFHLFAF